MYPFIRLSPRVLIVDDHASVRELVRQFVSILDADAQSCSANDGAEALSLFSTFHPDLVVLDVDMPVKNGTEVCEALRRRPEGEHVGVLAMSGNGSDQQREQLCKAGADAFLPKPFTLASFAAALRDVTRRRFPSAFH